MLCAVLVTASAFGPYVHGMTTGQAAVLTCAAFTFIAGWPVLVRAPAAPALMAIPWAGIVAVALIGTWKRPFDPGFYGPQSALHALWWLLTPPMVLVVTWYWAQRTPVARLITAVTRTIAACAAISGALAATQLATGSAALAGLLPRFWDASPEDRASVALRAVQNGRYTGIFDQPAEAGLVYGLALLCVVYLARRGQRQSLTAISGALVCCGGVLCVSKVFLLGALPLAAVTVMAGRDAWRRFLPPAVAAAGTAVLAWSAGWLPAWGPGRVALAALVHPAAGSYTAGRYGAGGGTLGPVAADVLRASPWGGFGLRGLGVAYDSQWLEILAVAGVIGLAMAAVAVIAVAVRWVSLRARMAAPERMLAGGVLALVCVAAAGFPSLTSIRGGTLTWLILGVLLAGPPGSPMSLEECHH